MDGERRKRDGTNFVDGDAKPSAYQLLNPHRCKNDAHPDGPSGDHHLHYPNLAFPVVKPKSASPPRLPHCCPSPVPKGLSPISSSTPFSGKILPSYCPGTFLATIRPNLRGLSPMVHVSKSISQGLCSHAWVAGLFASSL